MEMYQIEGVGLEVQRLPAPPGLPLRAPLVFLHEGLGSVAMWRNWPAEVCAATGRAGVVFSRRGYGQSDSIADVRGPSRELHGQRIGRLLPDYLHEEAWRVLPALLAQLKIEKPVLIGHSDGGSIALLHAARYPVEACVVMAPHVIVEDISVKAITEARDAFESSLRERLARYHANVDGTFWQWNDIWLSDAFRSFDIRADCHAITAPVLAIQGEQDPYGTMAQIDEIAPAGRIERIKLAACGHSPHRDLPDATTEAIRSFLDRLND